MTVGAPDDPREARPGLNGPTMTESNKDMERGEKRGVLSTGRAKDLDKTKDADADDAADDDDDEEEED